MECLEAACHRTWPQHLPDLRRLRDALEVSGAEIRQLEETAEESSGAVADDDGIWVGDSLQTRCEIRRLTDDAVLPHFSRFGQIAHHNQSGRNSHPRLQRPARLET